MNYWNEQDGIYEFRDSTPDEAAKQRTATDSSRWVRCQLEWCQMVAVADAVESPSVRPAWPTRHEVATSDPRDAVLV